MFQLIFRGERTAGTDEQTARANAMALFKATIAQVDRMFSGQRVVIRNGLDQATALKYQAVLRKNGLVAHIESMEEQADEQGRQAGGPAAPAEGGRSAGPSTGGSEASRPAAGSGVKVEPGDRLEVAGEKVDQILAGSSLSVDEPGVRLSGPRSVEVPRFEHLDEITLAPVGADLEEIVERPPTAVPDISHLSLVDEEDERSP